MTLGNWNALHWSQVGGPLLQAIQLPLTGINFSTLPNLARTIASYNANILASVGLGGTQEIKCSGPRAPRENQCVRQTNVSWWRVPGRQHHLQGAVNVNMDEGDP